MLFLELGLGLRLRLGLTLTLIRRSTSLPFMAISLDDGSSYSKNNPGGDIQHCSTPWRRRAELRGRWHLLGFAALSNVSTNMVLLYNYHVGGAATRAVGNPGMHQSGHDIE